MDRILTRKDHEGNAVVFLPDTLKDGKLLAWYGQSNVEPELVSMDYYKTTKELDEKEAKRLKTQFEKVYGNGPVFLMQRLPRGLLKAFKEAKQAIDNQRTQSAPVERAPALTQAEKAHYRAMKAVKQGRFWEVQDDAGETQAIVASKEEAMRYLEQSLTLH